MDEKDNVSLSCLNIPMNPNNRSFNCKTITQSELVNTRITILGFLEDVPTKYSRQKGTSGQILVHIKTQDGDERKFFTGSQEIAYVLRWVQENSTFPRTAIVKCLNNRYWLE